MKRAADAKIGAVTFIQRFDSGLRLNVHFHTLFLDKDVNHWFCPTCGISAVSKVASVPPDDEGARAARGLSSEPRLRT